MSQSNATETPPSSFFERIVEVAKSAPTVIAAVGSATAIIMGALAFFLPTLRDRIHPPPIRNGIVTDFALEERMTLKDYLAFMDASGMANSIADAPHSEAEKRQIGRHVQFRVEVTGYVRHRCEIDYHVTNSTGSAIIPERSLIAFYPQAEQEGGTYDLWVPRAVGETLNVDVFDDSPRPPGLKLATQLQPIDWK